MPEAIVQTRGLTKIYGQMRALDNLDLEIEQGSIYGFIGPNGAGKTTCMRILCTLLEPTSGEAWINGLSVRDEPEKIRMHIGYMPDFFGVYGDMKVWEYMDFFARCYKIPQDRIGTLTDELLELVTLQDKKDDYVESLSRGMKQRLCLARTLIHDPDLLVLDEPASGLDPRARIEMRELLKELRSMGKTIMLSSHILTELADVCTHIGIIEKGRLLASGQVDEMIYRLQLQRRIRLVLTGGASGALEVLSSTNDVNDVQVMEPAPQTDEDPATISFGLTSPSNNYSPLIARLIEAGAQIREFVEERGDLEDVFMQVTKGEVQ